MLIPVDIHFNNGDFYHLIPTLERMYEKAFAGIAYTGPTPSLEKSANLTKWPYFVRYLCIQHWRPLNTFV
jgi:hypothetical protein